MTIADWIQANSVWIVFVVTIIVLVYYIVIVIKTFKKRRRIITPLAFILTVWGLLFFIYIVFMGSKIGLADWAQILLLGGLVSVTAAYAYSTEKMAEEMREQRYDTVRPVIDIEKEESPQAEIVQGLAVRDGLIGIGLPCKLHNIGLGPATDLYSFIRDDQNIRRRFDFGTLAARGKTESMGLYASKEENNRMFLAAYYRDIYGRVFESSREVIIDKEKGSLEFGPLTIRPVEEDKS